MASSNVLVKVVIAVGKELEVAAEDILHYSAVAAADATKATPGVVASLALVANGIAKAGSDVVLDASNPAAILVGGLQQLQDFMAVWPETKAFLASLGVTKI